MSEQTMDQRTHATTFRALSFRERRRRIVSHVMIYGTGVAAALTVLPLLLIFFHLLRAGLGSLNPDFFTNVPAPVGETGGGVGNGVLGTFLLVGLAGAMGLPVAIGAGIYLAEAEGGKLANGIRFVTDVMNGIPSIVIGIFVWAWVVVTMGHFSALAGGVALTNVAFADRSGTEATGRGQGAMRIGALMPAHLRRKSPVLRCSHSSGRPPPPDCHRDRAPEEGVQHAITSTPSRCKAMMTSFPSSPEPRSMTLVAEAE